MSKEKIQILFIDDEIQMLPNLEFNLGKVYEFAQARNMKLAEPMLKQNDYDLILLDLDLEKRGDNNKGYKKGLENIPVLKKDYPEIPIIIVTQTRSQDIAVEAMDKGADYFFWKSDFNAKKWQRKIEELTDRKYLRNSLKKLEKEGEILKRKLKAEKEAKYPFIGCSPQIEEIKRTLKLVAEELPDLTVLLTGETGVGKEVAAHYFYANSIRNQHDFVPVNLTEISKELLVSTLFGSRKGSFTSSEKDRIGYFQQANKGILFLDEIGEISIDVQIKILRFLQDKEIRVVGDSKTISLDVQIIAATNKDLDKAVKNKEFRADLFQRLNAYPIHIPPLRERKEDIMPIVAHYLKVPQKLVENNFFTPKAKTLFLNYSWLGNVRELVNAVNYMKIQQRIKGRNQFDEDCLPDYVLYSKPLEVSYEMEGNDFTHEESVTLIELKRIEAALLQKSKKKEAAELLEMDSDGLRYKVKGYFKKYPNLFKDFKTIVVAYKLKR